MLSDDDYERIERLVEDFRTKLGVADDERLDLNAILDRMVSLGYLDGYGPTSEPGVEGQFDPERNYISFRQDVLLSDEPRARFTKAHELGHRIAGHSMVRNRSGATPKYGRELVPDERVANALAGALLIPERLARVNELSSAADLSARFGVSLAVAEIRLTELQRRRRKRLGVLRPLPISDIDQSFDSGDYSAAMPQMGRNAHRWNR